MPRVLKDDLKTSPYKMQKRHELTDRREQMRLERCQHILGLIATTFWPNLVFSDEKNLTLNKALTVKMTEFGVGMDLWQPEQQHDVKIPCP
jgi:hypothetical protein